MLVLFLFCLSSLFYFIFSVADKNISEQLQELHRLKKGHIEKEKVMYQAMFKS